MEDSTHCWIYVEQTQDALQRIATAYRNQFQVPVVGVTGVLEKPVHEK